MRRVVLKLNIALFGLLAAAWGVSVRIPFNDSFIDALPAPSSGGVVVTDMQGATMEAGEPMHAGGRAGKSVWWEFTAATNGVVNISTYGNAAYSPYGILSSSAPYLAVYKGDTLESLREIASNNGLVTENIVSPTAISPVRAMSLSVPVTEGTRYRIAMAGETGLPTSPGAVLGLDMPPVIISGISASATRGKNFSYTITAANEPWKYAVTGLPDGLVINPVLGEISGVPQYSGTFNLVMSATNTAGSGSARLSLVVSEPAAIVNTPPVWVYEHATLKVGVGKTISETYWAYNLPTSFSATGLPPGLTLTTGSGGLNGVSTKYAQISGSAAAGTYPVRLRALNAMGSSEIVVTYIITAAVQPPVITSSAFVAGTKGVSFSTLLSTLYDSSDPSATKTYSASNLPPGLTLNSSNGLISGTATTPGVYTVPVSASSSGVTAPAVVTIRIADAPPVLPTLAISSAATALGNVGRPFSYTVTADASPDSITCGALPPGLSFDPASRVISGTATVTGTYSVPVTAVKGGDSVAATLNFTILPANVTQGQPRPAIASAASKEWVKGQYSSYSIITNPSSFTAWYSATPLPPGLSLTPYSGAITGVPSTTGTYEVELTAVDASGTSSALVTFHVVNSPSNAPTITSPASVRFPGNTFSPFETTSLPLSYKIGTSYPAQSFAASGLPSGLVMNSVTGEISGVPQIDGGFRFPISAVNVSGTRSSTLTVVSNILAPQITSRPHIVGAAGQSLRFMVTTNLSSNPFLTGVQKAAPTFSADELPAGLSLNRATGVISGTPLAAGIYATKLTCTNTVGTSVAFLNFLIASGAPPVSAPPTLTSGAAGTLSAVGMPLSMSYWAVGADSLTAANLPPGMSFSVSNGTSNGAEAKVGKISGTPTTSGTFSVPVSASNGLGTVQGVLTFLIEPAPQSPVISSDASGRGSVGSPLFYWTTVAYNSVTWNTPTAYSAQALPPGLTIDPADGRITGTPMEAGVYESQVSATIAGQTGSATVIFTISSDPAASVSPVFSGTAGDLGFVGVPFLYSLRAQGASEIVPPVLPAGLLWSTGVGHSNGNPFLSGQISGTPESAGDYVIPISAMNSSGTSSVLLTLKIVQPQGAIPVLTGKPSNTTVAAGAPISLQAAAQGAPPPDFQWSRNGSPIAGQTSATLALAATDLPDAGTYEVVASNAYGSESASALLRLNQNFANWQKSVFNPEEIASGAADPLGDFNADGQVNLLDYALGGNPRTGSGGRLSIYIPPGGLALQIEFSRDTRKTDVSYLVEASPDLQTWTTIASSENGGAFASVGDGGEISETAGEITDVTIRDRQALDGVPRRFLRLKVLQH